MRVRIDHPLYGWSAEVDLPVVPREGEALTLNGIERQVRHVIWHVTEFSPGEQWAQIVLRPNSDDQ